jgi:hypothetical protein
MIITCAILRDIARAGGRGRKMRRDDILGLGLHYMSNPELLSAAVAAGRSLAGHSSESHKRLDGGARAMVGGPC